MSEEHKESAAEVEENGAGGESEASGQASGGDLEAPGATAEEAAEATEETTEDATEEATEEAAGEPEAEPGSKAASEMPEPVSTSGKSEKPAKPEKRKKGKKDKVKPQEVVVVRLKLSFFNILSLTFQIVLAVVLVVLFLAAAVGAGLYFLKDYLSEDILGNF